ncbi:DUF7010 family protein [Ornithinimicrobium faecis]|uniref:DUF7010 family protein n=1 Tax=Ornithinimicrobium faecis TaxID=2934158 RepID=UPI0021181BED|nr:hypothetical protein [Ornithinimicrobium sp. HY1745]
MMSGPSASTTDVQDYLEVLAEVNHNGFGFLVAFGLTWLVAGGIWLRFGEKAGAYAALFQGTAGVPLGLLLTSLTATAGRPDDPSMNALSIYLGAGQLLVLPLAIVLIVQHRYLAVAAVMALVLAVHFVPYAWLYGTPVYLAAAAVVAVLTATVVAIDLSRERSHGALLCVGTGATLLLGGLAALLL